MSEISAVHTSCKSCVFAEYNGITQTDCKLHYIDKYRNKNIEILEAYDDSNEFFIINNKKCVGYRENPWFAKYGLENASIEDKISKFKELNYLNYLLLIDLKVFNLEQLKNLKNQIDNCKIKPKKIIIVRYRDTKSDFVYDNIKSIFSKFNEEFTWRIQTMIDESLTHEDILHNATNMNKGYRFIVSIKEPNSDLEHIVNKANTIVHDDLDQFDVITNKEKSILLFSAPSYRWSIAVQKKNILDETENHTVI